MWFLAIVAGIVIVIMAGFLSRYARRADHPALRSFAESAGLPVLVASIFVALGLARHDTAWTLAWVVLTSVAWTMSLSVPERLAEHARRAGRPALGGFTRSANFLVSIALFWVALGLALHHVYWANLAEFLLAFVGWTVLRTLWRRRNNA